jgi:hypothetical protein
MNKGTLLKYKYVLLDDRQQDGGVPMWEPGSVLYVLEWILLTERTQEHAKENSK